MTRLPPLDPKLVSLLWAGPERAAEIASIHARMFEVAWDAAGVMKLLEHPASTGFIAQVGIPKITVGFIMGQIMADEAEILLLQRVRWLRTARRRLLSKRDRQTSPSVSRYLFPRQSQPIAK